MKSNFIIKLKSEFSPQSLNKMTSATDRNSLPYRKNCEGYLIYGGSYVLAQDTGKGYVLFPGGGVDAGETPEEALRRETSEETGAVIGTELKKIGVLHFDWSPKWAKTKKQKSRFGKFRGEEMHLFIGKIKKFQKPLRDLEDIWQGEKLMLIENAIKAIERDRPFPQNMREYHHIQLKCLRSLKSRKVTIPRMNHQKFKN